VTKPQVKRAALAYSGGLDTSIIVPWLKQNYGNPEVVCYCANLGQADELTGLEEKAKASGASKCYVEDLREEFSPIAYLASAQEPRPSSGVQLLIRSNLPQGEVVASVKNKLEEANPAIAVSFAWPCASVAAGASRH